MIVFDMDGVLLDTRAAKLAAYRAIGVEPPEDFHLRPWQEWCSGADHEAREREYARHSHMIRDLPLLAYLRVLPNHGRDGSLILTASSAESLKIARQRLPDVLIVRCSAEDRADFLRKMTCGGDYYDDNAATCEAVSRLDGWRATHVRSL